MAYASSFSMDYHSLPLALLILLWGVVLASSLPAAFDWRNSNLVAPAAFDWRDKNLVTPVKNQLVCDHSWAFAAVSVVESALLRSHRGTGQQFDLSEQQVLDCSKGRGSLGCIKGNVVDALSYITTFVGLFEEGQYPYNGVSTGVCRQPLGTLVPTLDLKPYLTLRIGESKLVEALLRYGPAAVTMCSPSDLVTYRGGVYFNPSCNANCNNTISMTLVGYGTQNRIPYWIFKNSWGTLWGEGGYFKLARGFNMCDIVKHPSYFLPRN